MGCFSFLDAKVQEMIKHLLGHMPLIFDFSDFKGLVGRDSPASCLRLLFIVIYFLGVSCFSNYKDIVDYEF